MPELVVVLDEGSIRKDGALALLAVDSKEGGQLHTGLVKPRRSSPHSLGEPVGEAGSAEVDLFHLGVGLSIWVRVDDLLLLFIVEVSPSSAC